MNQPTLRQLQYFAALAEHLHFADAAATCGVSQPNLSSQIRELEASLGGVLVERTSRSVLLTELGKMVLQRARPILADVEDLMLAAQRNVDAFSTRMRFGVIPTIAPYVLPRALPAVRQRWPELELQLIEDFTDNLIAKLRSGEIDVAMMALPYDERGLAHAEIVHEPFVVIAPTSHPISKSKRIRSQDFQPADLLLLREGHCLRDQSLEVCHLQSSSAADVVEGSSLTMLVQMVANGFGLTLLPAMAVPIETSSTKEVTVIPFTKPQPGRTLVLVWRTTSPHADAYSELAETLKEKTSSLL